MISANESSSENNLLYVFSSPAQGEGRVRAGASEGAETGGLVEERAWGKEECYKKGAEGASEST